MTGTVTPARRAALEILGAVGRGRRLDLAWEEEAAPLPDRDRRWLQELTYGTVRLRGRIDRLLDVHLRQGIRSVQGPLLDLLRLGAYQLLHMDGVPAYAAVSQAVEQARSDHGPGAGGLVNGVLRTVARRGEDPALFPDPVTDPGGFLADWHSHPRWLVDRWLARSSLEEVRSRVEADNRVPPLTLTPVGASVEEVVERLRAAGVEAHPVEGGTGSVRVGGGTSPAEALERVPAVVQDPAAALVVRYVDPEPACTLADLCAAPGGKALALSPGVSYVLAADPSFPRLDRLRENARRLGARIGIVAARAERPPVAHAEVVLLDVPCTGTGTLRRHPDARWRLREADVGTLAALQERILDGAAGVVPPGGLLVYATCTLEPEENEDQVDAFLRRHPEFEMDPGDSVPPRWLDGEGRLRVRPEEAGFDGAFAARMRRRS